LTRPPTLEYNEGRGGKRVSLPKDENRCYICGGKKPPLLPYEIKGMGFKSHEKCRHLTEDWFITIYLNADYKEDK